MKKIATTLFLLVLCANIALSQNPIITMTTTKGNGNSIIFSLRSVHSTTVNIDFGNGTIQNFPIESTSISIINGTISGSSVKIYGSDAEIKYIYCSSCNLTNLDVSKNKALYWLDCHNNQLTSLDLTQNSELQYLDCENNKLSTLTLKKNIPMGLLRCNNNLLSFATLPVEEAFWGAYYYAPQQSISIAKNYNTGDMIDLSSQLLAGGNTTLYKWKTKSGVLLAEGTDYSINMGKTVFLKPQTDSVYCEMTNTSFPDFKDANTLKTTNTRITGASISVITITTAKNIGSAFSFILQANANNTPVKVDYGNGTLINNTVGTEESTISVSLIGSKTVKIYGTGIVYLDCSRNEITSLDVSYIKDLEALDCYGNQLVTIDVSHNTALQTLSCGDNLLKELDISSNTTLALLYCYNNKLSDLNLTNNKELITLNCSHNQLSNLDVKSNTQLTSFTCSNNDLKLLDVSANTKLFNLTCSNNLFKFSTLPTSPLGIQEYRYFPQKPVSIAKSFNIGETIDLSDQNLIGTNTTNYTLRTKSGTTLVEGTDYSILKGKIKFLKAQTDSVYCRMTNTTFPYLSGSDVLKTTNTLIMNNTGIQTSEIEKIDIQVYPNPATNHLYFKNKKCDGKNAEIVNQTGKVVWQGIVQHECIEVSNLPKGFYMLRINNKDLKFITTRFIKQ
jgi:hypothetical protein